MSNNANSGYSFGDYSGAISNVTGQIGSFLSTSAASAANVASAKINVKAQEAQAEEIRKSGDSVYEAAADEARRLRRESLEFRSNQVATAARNGVIVGDGSALDMTSKTLALARQDIQMMYHNADKKAQSLFRGADDMVESAYLGLRYAEKAEEKAKKGGIMGTIGSVAGGLIAGYFTGGNPAAVSAGASIGGAIGSSAGSN